MDVEKKTTCCLNFTIEFYADSFKIWKIAYFIEDLSAITFRTLNDIWLRRNSRVSGGFYTFVSIAQLQLSLIITIICICLCIVMKQISNVFSIFK